MTNRERLRDFIKSVPGSLMSLAMNAVVGSLCVTCTDEDMDEALRAAKEEVQKAKEEQE